MPSSPSTFANSCGSTTAPAVPNAIQRRRRPTRDEMRVPASLIDDLADRGARLRVIAVVLASALPTILLLLPFSHALAGLAVLAHVAGMLAARWLFFAEAEHVVGLYYGKR